MALPLVYRRNVGRDLAGGYAWYNGQRDGLGEKFLAAVTASFDAIEGEVSALIGHSSLSVSWTPNARKTLRGRNGGSP